MIDANLPLELNALETEVLIKEAKAKQLFVLLSYGSGVFLRPGVFNVWAYKIVARIRWTCVKDA